MTFPNTKENVKTLDKVTSDTSEQITHSNLAALGVGVLGGFGSASVSAPVTVAGAVVCVAAYGAKKAIQEKDCCALISVAGGAFTGAGISAILGGMSLALAETAVGISMGPIVAAGATIGLAGYGLTRLVQRVMTVQANYVPLKNMVALPLRSKL
ncbi:MAG: hypothetical protein KA714_17900 [Limnoraphis sp. WC205]|jgi:hypothetical protein|nr:hypothetical protein [Limnoraphis sp. WC205]